MSTKELRKRISELEPKVKVQKYRNKAIVIDGIKFQSIAEGCRYTVLKHYQDQGVISCLELQVPFILAPSVIINGRKKPALKYFADFVYSNKEGKRIIEDVKGVKTAVYKIKQHLMLSVYGFEINEIK